ncbi:ABR216Wp [Eremothecium gossypii ATCC 10895]|uniref:COX assembly mitochondrial protein n=1 Tax=Eremothecium gossypii (strain ATCC 10895 / CBS 109.51 / FGSC 9923 / NRRL Y-1056) TaxID=284811 RepID=Q75D06_EREGS|nr:ABR216Wp [Eremothecium gossypii ATCC 10895]AAS50989.1 ABR216Wp [Eremothecium gossypii ATCC 10895]AEY95278.1 FABR216Wp [Eremothecium gossypii FDAG1]
MHPQLEAQRFHSCLDLVQALEKCHQADFYKQAFGLCNPEKEALTQCLHNARLEGEKYHILANREKRKEMDAKWKQMQEEEYGEDALLKILLQRQLERKQSGKTAE